MVAQALLINNEKTGKFSLALPTGNRSAYLIFNKE